jgi:hypothetical protein
MAWCSVKKKAQAQLYKLEETVVGRGLQIFELAPRARNGWFRLPLTHLTQRRMNLDSETLNIT